MLTDIFATRYADVELWDRFGDQESRLIVQAFRLLEEEIFPYVNASDQVMPGARAFWTELHDRLSTELGRISLSGRPVVSPFRACKDWMLTNFGGRDEADRFVKERLSLVELGFRTKANDVAAAAARLASDAKQMQSRVAAKGGMLVPSGSSSTGRPWKENSFRNAWANATRAAGISGLTFHDLRGTAVTRLSEAECSLQEIATITGHSLRDVAAIIDRYSGRTDKLAQSAVAKLERSRT